MNLKLISIPILLSLAFLPACSHQQTVSEDAPQPIYEITKIVNDLYRASSDNHNTVFLVTPRGTILADPLNLDFAEWLKDQLAERFDSEVKYVLYSHHHWDHASGGAAFADSAEFIGHEAMIAALALPLAANYVAADANGDGAIQRSEAGGGLAIYFDKVDANGDGKVTGTEMNRDIVPPTITYSDNYPVYLNSQEVQIIYGGDAHSDDTSILSFTDEATAFGVDWLTIRSFPRILYGKDLEIWIETADRMISLGVTHVAPGHGEMGRLEDLIAFKQFFIDLRDATNTAISGGMSKEDFQASISLPAYSEWAAYDTRLPALAGEAYDLSQQQ